MTPPLVLLYHYFEVYRFKILSLGVERHTAEFPTSQQLEADILVHYDPARLVEAMQLYKFLVQAFHRRLRPPSYATAFERRLRGWKRAGPSNQDLAIVLLVGGIREVERIWSIKSYDQRRRALDDWMATIKPTSSESTSPGKKRLPRVGAVLRFKSDDEGLSPATSASGGPSVVYHGDQRPREQAATSPVGGKANGHFVLVPPSEYHYQRAVEFLVRIGLISGPHALKGPGPFISDLVRQPDTEVSLENGYLESPLASAQTTNGEAGG